MNHRNHNFKLSINEENLFHVFIINSPIVEILAKLVIEKYKILENRVIIINIRDTYCGYLKGKSIKIKRFIILEKIFSKIFIFSLHGILLRKEIEKLNNNFVFYTPWDSDESIEIINSKYCKHFSYLEEGQMSYNEYEEYKFKNERKIQRARIKKKNLSLTSQNYTSDKSFFSEYFNNKSFKYFCLSNEAFPLIKDDKKIVLDNVNVIKKIYKPKLIGRKCIGIFCSPRRIRKNKLKDCLGILLSNLPINSALKLHPDMYSYFYYKEIKFFLKEFNRFDIYLCEKDIIIEGEMLFEKKNLFGPLSSLIKYAEIYGSNFKKIDIY